MKQALVLALILVRYTPAFAQVNTTAFDRLRHDPDAVILRAASAVNGNALDVRQTVAAAVLSQDLRASDLFLIGSAVPSATDARFAGGSALDATATFGSLAVTLRGGLFMDAALSRDVAAFMRNGSADTTIELSLTGTHAAAMMRKEIGLHHVRRHDRSSLGAGLRLAVNQAVSQPLRISGQDGASPVLEMNSYGVTSSFIAERHRSSISARLDLEYERAIGQRTQFALTLEDVGITRVNGLTRAAVTADSESISAFLAILDTVMTENNAGVNEIMFEKPRARARLTHQFDALSLSAQGGQLFVWSKENVLEIGASKRSSWVAGNGGVLVSANGIGWAGRATIRMANAIFDLAAVTDGGLRLETGRNVQVSVGTGFAF